MGDSEREMLELKHFWDFRHKWHLAQFGLWSMASVTRRTRSIWKNGFNSGPVESDVYRTTKWKYGPGPWEMSWLEADGESTL